MIFNAINMGLALVGMTFLLIFSSRLLLSGLALLLLVTATVPIIMGERLGHDLEFLLLVVSSLLAITLFLFSLYSAKGTRSEKAVPPPSPPDSSPDEHLWKSLLQLSNPDALCSDWQSCFNRIHDDICRALEADDLFILAYPPTGGSPYPFQDINGRPGADNSWITTVDRWKSILRNGEQIHNVSDGFEMEEEVLLNREGIKVILLLPLLVKGELFGLLGINKKRESVLFDQRQTNNTRFIANILAMAISNQHDRSERDRLVTVVEQSSDCIIITNPGGSVLYANPACKKVTGFSPYEIVGRSIKRLYRSPIRKKLWHQMKEDLGGGKGWNDHFANYRKDGTLYQEAMEVSPVYDQDGNVINRVIVKRDITEEKRLESIAEAANLMDNIGLIFSSIRHELGNPINAIKVSLSVLESNLEGYTTEDVKRFVSRGLSDISRVEYLLKSLKNFSIFERPDVQSTDMGNLLEKLTKLTEKDLAKQYVMLAINQPGAPLIGLVDPRAFLQVLLNLIANAVAALDGCDNKQISLTLTQKQKRQIALTLEDNGCGMDEDTIKNLFSPFFTTKAEGTGLGLVIVKKMLAKMNCSITVNSQKGKGTCMEIIIPAA
ncbi:MAG: ATP-binding protein [Thermodesulfobacteriota bacterium]